MTRRGMLVAAMAMLAGAAAMRSAPAAEQIKGADPDRKRVDLVICLDTSGSMRGLIESAKQKLWAVVNELATAKPRPALRVALYQYGNTGLSSESGWVQQLCPLTDDLDSVYGKLFPLTTNGGTEYVSRVVRAATRELDWHRGRGTLRVIFVAGNEAATQDRKYPLRETCKAAISEGIIVNTIYCGDESGGRTSGWADAAAWADGQYSAIDQDRGTVAVSTPYDKRLAELSGKLNTTYVAFGSRGSTGAARQTRMDAKAGGVHPTAAAERAKAKASGLYRNTDWDLVDATAEGKVKVEDVPADELPEAMREMTVEERKKHVAEQAARRATIQKEIKELSAKRDAYVKEQMASKGLSEERSLDAALRRTVRAQAEKKGMEFEKK